MQELFSNILHFSSTVVIDTSLSDYLTLSTHGTYLILTTEQTFRDPSAREQMAYT